MTPRQVVEEHHDLIIIVCAQGVRGHPDVVHVQSDDDMLPPVCCRVKRKYKKSTGLLSTPSRTSARFLRYATQQRKWRANKLHLTLSKSKDVRLNAYEWVWQLCCPILRISYYKIDLLSRGIVEVGHHNIKNNTH